MKADGVALTEVTEVTSYRIIIIIAVGKRP